MLSDLANMLESMAVLKASDLYINVGAPPTFKVHGELRSVTDVPLNSEQVQRMILDVLDDEQKQRFQASLELDVSLQIENGGRFRLNIYRQKGALALVARHIKNIIPTIEELNLPDVLKDLIMAEQGLLLVVGATGSGKSSTLASMIDYRNENRQGHILTVEDPIEFVHYHKKSLISQREIGVDTNSYADALKFALREAPNVIVIGEIRDQETARQALRFAETGHLCLATLHATSTNLAIDRLVNFFPPDAHRQIYQDVASHLVAIVAQRLAKGLKQPRVPAVEILLNNMHIAGLIERGDIHSIKEVMSKEHADTCQTFDDALYQLMVDEEITKEEAKRLADSQVDLMLRVRMEANTQGDSYFSNISDWRDPEADFRRYSRVLIDPRKVDTDRRPDMKETLSAAISQELKNHGYEVVVSKPDLVLRFSFGLRTRATSDDRENASQQASERFSSDFSKLPSYEAGLAIQLVEAKGGKVIWKMHATRPLGQRMGGVQEFQEKISGLLNTLPSKKDTPTESDLSEEFSNLA
jgi:twitching motility protein PilU